MASHKSLSILDLPTFFHLWCCRTCNMVLTRASYVPSVLMREENFGGSCSAASVGVQDMTGIFIALEVNATIRTAAKNLFESILRTAEKYICIKATIRATEKEIFFSKQQFVELKGNMCIKQQSLQLKRNICIKATIRTAEKIVSKQQPVQLKHFYITINWDISLHVLGGIGTNNVFCLRLMTIKGSTTSSIPRTNLLTAPSPRDLPSVLHLSIYS